MTPAGREGQRRREKATAALSVLERRLASLKDKEDAARDRYRAACAEMFSGRGDSIAVERAEVALERAERDVRRARAASAYWREPAS